MKTPSEIKQIVEASGLTQTEFAAKLGVSASTVASWLMGRRRPGTLALRQLDRLARRT